MDNMDQALVRWLSRGAPEQFTYVDARFAIERLHGTTLHPAGRKLLSRELEMCVRQGWIERVRAEATQRSATYRIVRRPELVEEVAAVMARTVKAEADELAKIVLEPKPIPGPPARLGFMQAMLRYAIAAVRRGTLDIHTTSWQHDVAERFNVPQWVWHDERWAASWRRATQELAALDLIDTKNANVVHLSPRLHAEALQYAGEIEYASAIRVTCRRIDEWRRKQRETRAGDGLLPHVQ